MKRSGDEAKAPSALRRVSKRVENEIRGDEFGRFSAKASIWLGSKWGFLGAILVILLWGVTGPIFRFSDTWQLIINTGTTIVTFLMVFLIQNTQNRDSKAINLKLDELIRATTGAGDQMMNVQFLSDKELDDLQKSYERIRQECLTRQEKRGASK